MKCLSQVTTPEEPPRLMAVIPRQLLNLPKFKNSSKRSSRTCQRPLSRPCSDSRHGSVRTLIIATCLIPCRSSSHRLLVPRCRISIARTEGCFRGRQVLRPRQICTTPICWRLSSPRSGASETMSNRIFCTLNFMTERKDTQSICLGVWVWMATWELGSSGRLRRHRAESCQHQGCFHAWKKVTL